MNYQDDAVNKTVNGFVVGVGNGSALPDALDPGNDGYDHLRGIMRNGSCLQDALDPRYVAPSEE